MAEIHAGVKSSILTFLKKLREHGITPQKAYIFGSYSKGLESKFSDIDLAVVSTDLTDDRFNERLRLMKIASDIDNRLEPVPFNPNTFIEEDPLVWEILHSGMLIHPAKDM